VPYNLFKLFLVHKISAYKYIYENGKKKWEKEKEKEFSASWAGGGFRPSRAQARARARQVAQPAHEKRGRHGRRRGRGPMRQREERRDDVRGEEGGPRRGRTDRR
jgi:hypothetical protein